MMGNVVLRLIIGSYLLFRRTRIREQKVAGIALLDREFFVRNGIILHIQVVAETGLLAYRAFVERF